MSFRLQKSHTEPLQLNLDVAGVAGDIYEELHQKNVQLRSNYHTLAQEFSALKCDHEYMRQMLMNLCYGLEECAADIRAVVGEPKLPSNCCLETENKLLNQANEELVEANRRMKAENESMSSELCSRGATNSCSTSPSHAPNYL